MADYDEIMRQLQQQAIAQAREHFSETVVEHWLSPRNPHAMEHPDGHAKIKGPCGDTMEIFIRVGADQEIEASFLTDGCITSIVSGSMAVDLASGRRISEAMSISPREILERLGGLPEGSQHCALLASNTLHQALLDCVNASDRLRLDR